MISQQLIRRFTTSAIRRSAGHDNGGYPGSSLPFSIENRYKITLYFTVFLSSGFVLPYIMVRHQLLKG